MDALELLLSRRSTRSYTEEPVDPAELGRIIDAGRHAPSGGNNQTTRFFVIRDAALLSRLQKVIKQELAKLEPTEDMYPSLAKAVRASKGEKYIFNYNAPVLIVTANKINYPNNIADCACALENMMIMANALDLGSCYLNHLRLINENEVIISLFRELGMADDERIYGSVCIGHPATPDGLPVREPLPRTGNPVVML